ncbi:MAG: hypothetical protein AB7O92_32130 [Acidimicrobiia bacterium]
MISLAMMIVVWLLLAAGIGLGTGWLVWGWWAQRPPSHLPTEEELQRLRSDLALAREEVADLRAVLNGDHSNGSATPPATGAPEPAPASTGTGVIGTGGAGARGRRVAVPVPRDVTDTDTDWGATQGFLLASNVPLDQPDDAGTAPSVPATAGGAAEGGSLRTIPGIGVKLERALHRRGVRSLEHLAVLNRDEIDALDASLGEFQGRIHRDDWVGQARRLLELDER